MLEEQRVLDIAICPLAVDSQVRRGFLLRVSPQATTRRWAWAILPRPQRASIRIAAIVAYMRL